MYTLVVSTFFAYSSLFSGVVNFDTYTIPNMSEIRCREEAALRKSEDSSKNLFNRSESWQRATCVKQQ